MHEFIIPLYPEGLIKDTGDARFFVKKNVAVHKLPLKDINKLLDGITTRMIDGDCLEIVNNENFDALYGFLSNYTNLKQAAKDGLLNVLKQGLDLLPQAVATVISSKNTITQKTQDEDMGSELQELSVEVLKCKNALKMYLFLFQWLISIEEKDELKGPAIFDNKKKKRKNTEAPSSKQWHSVQQKEAVLSSLVHILELELKSLWKGSVEEDFLNLFTKIACLMLESPTNTKSKQVKQCIFTVVANVVQRFEQSGSVMPSIVHLLHRFEHLATPAAELMVVLAKDFNCDFVIGDVLSYREIGRATSSSNNKDASGLKNIAAFIIEIAEKLPKEVLPFVSLLIVHLGDESYALRSGIIQAFGHLIEKAFNETEDDDDRNEEKNKQRDNLFQVLESRFADITSFTRSKLLQTWQKLVTARAIPLKFLGTLTDLTIGRLQDKASMVRKYAIILLRTILEFNPYNPKLSLSAFEKKLEQANEELKKLPAVEESKETENEEEEEDLYDSDEERKQESNLATGASAQQRLQQQKLCDFYEDCVSFIKKMHFAIEKLGALLGSKNITDIQESIGFLVAARQFEIEAAEDGFRNVLALVWNKDAAIKSATIDAYTTIYLKPPVATSKKQEAYFTATNLIKLVLNASRKDLTSLEELIKEMVVAKDKSGSLIRAPTRACLWSIFGMHSDSNTLEESLGALIVLCFAANGDKTIVSENTAKILKYGLSRQSWKEDERFAKYSCLALQKLAQVDGHEEPVKFPATHEVFSELFQVLTTATKSTQKWFAAAEQCITAIYKLSEHPDSICGNILKQFGAPIFAPPTSEGLDSIQQPVTAAYVSKFVFMVGHIALQQLIWIESLQAEINRRREIREKQTENKKDNESEAIEEELGINAANEESEAEFIQAVIEKEVVCSNLLSSFAPLVVSLCTNSVPSVSSTTLRTAAVLTLCKFMTVSATFCQQHLRILFTILEKDTESLIRSDIVIALGDLVSRHHNIVSAWTPHLYSRLRDSDPNVRVNALMVVSHLILNEMIKIKGQISIVAECLVDKEEKIANLAKLFFHELANKSNAIYNVLPDIISQLSETKEVNYADFQIIMRYLLSFIQRELQTESLIEKLCKRFLLTNELDHWRDISFCLSMLNYRERGIKKIIECFKCYSTKLTHDEVYKNFVTIISKAKNRAKPELRETVDELEAKIIKCHEGDGTEEDTKDITMSTAKESTKEKKTKSTNKRTRKAAPKRKSTRSTRKRAAKQYDSSDEEDEEEMNLDDDSPPQEDSDDELLL